MVNDLGNMLLYLLITVSAGIAPGRCAYTVMALFCSFSVGSSSLSIVPLSGGPQAYGPGALKGVGGYAWAPRNSVRLEPWIGL
jgi:hypothetical protein